MNQVLKPRLSGATLNTDHCRVLVRACKQLFCSFSAFRCVSTVVRLCLSSAFLLYRSFVGDTRTATPPQPTRRHASRLNGVDRLCGRVPMARSDSLATPPQPTRWYASRLDGVGRLCSLAKPSRRARQPRGVWMIGPGGVTICHSTAADPPGTVFEPGGVTICHSNALIHPPHAGTVWKRGSVARTRFQQVRTPDPPRTSTARVGSVFCDSRGSVSRIQRKSCPDQRDGTQADYTGLRHHDRVGQVFQ